MSQLLGSSAGGGPVPPQVDETLTGNAGVATAAANNINVVAAAGSGSFVGAGNTLTYTAAVTPFTWTVEGASPVAMVANNGYFSNAVINFNLPAVAVVGDTYSVVNSVGAWTIVCGAGQSIAGGVNVTGVSLQSLAIGDSVTLVCRVANTVFVIVNGNGNFQFN